MAHDLPALEDEVTRSLRSWRQKTGRSKAAPWAIPDIESGHLLSDPSELSLSEACLLPWAAVFARSSPSVRVLGLLSSVAPSLTWTPSPWLRDVGPGPLHRVRVTAGSPESLDAVARCFVQGAAWARNDREDAVLGFVVGGAAADAPKQLPVPVGDGLEVRVDTFDLPAVGQGDL